MERYRPKPDELELIGRSDSALVEHYQPKFLGMGGDQVVYEIPNHPNVVVKVGYELLRESIEENLRNGRAGNNLNPEYERYFADMKENREEINRLFAEYFGEEHLVPERMFLMEVPLTSEIINSLFVGEPPEEAKNLKSAWTRVVVQEKVPALQGEHLSFSPSGRPEQRKGAIDPESYRRATDILLKGLPGEFALDDFLRLIDNPNEQPLRSLWMQIEKDPELKELVADFVKRGIKYVNETGRTFDAGGTDNIIFFKENGAWTYKLVDALLGAKKPLRFAREVLHDLAEGKPMTSDRSKLWATHKLVNFARLFNGFAFQLGLKDRIELFDEHDKNKEIDLLEILRKHPKP